MTTPRPIVTSVLTLLLIGSPLAAQTISFGLRGSGSIPTGSFAETGTSSTTNTAVIEGAKNGFGYGLDAGIGLGPIGIYAGFDHIKFDCQTTTCKSDGTYTLSGATAGVKLSLPSKSIVRPFVKGGVTFHDLEGGYGGSTSNSLTTEKTPGYEIGVGADVNLAGIFSFMPQARYVGQQLKAKIPGVNTPPADGTGVNYFSFDLGFAVHTPWK
jgi:hypothetical protein